MYAERFLLSTRTGWGALSWLFLSLGGLLALSPAGREATAEASEAEPPSRVPPKSSPVGYRKAFSHGVPLHVVQIDPRSPSVRLAVVTPRSGIGSRESWGGMVERARPAAAITGTYFGTDNLLPIGTLLHAGQVVHQGEIGTAFGFKSGHGARIIATKPGMRYRWSKWDMLVRAGPRLVSAGKRTLYPKAEGFRDPGVFGHKRRTGIAITKQGKLLLVATEKPVLLRTFAEALRRLGAVDAMCLDGGSSSALYFGGKTRVRPERSLTNLLVVYDSAARYDQQFARLNPGMRIAVARISGKG
jgi:hypothetical protein